MWRNNESKRVMMPVWTGWGEVNNCAGWWDLGGHVSVEWVCGGSWKGCSGSRVDFVLVPPYPANIGHTSPTSSGQDSGPHPAVFDCRVPESRVFRAVSSGQCSTWHQFAIEECWTAGGWSAQGTGKLVLSWDRSPGWRCNSTHLPGGGGLRQRGGRRASVDLAGVIPEESW